MEFAGCKNKVPLVFLYILYAVLTPFDDEAATVTPLVGDAQFQMLVPGAEEYEAVDRPLIISVDANGWVQAIRTRSM